ncbi:helix-turn-helix domain-containing protein [Chloroflexota bacterium]
MASSSNSSNSTDLGRMLRQQRLMIPLTLRGLGAIAGISSSHLGRIEKGERYPSASILRKMAKPLGFDESELFALAGYLPSPAPGIEERGAEFGRGKLDPYVSKVLSQEPIEVQRTVIGILSILKSITKALERE